MYSTILSIFISGLLIFLPTANNFLQLAGPLTIIFIGLSGILVVVTSLVLAMSWPPLQKVEQNLTPRLMDLFQNDQSIYFSIVWIFLFPILTLLISAELYLFQYLQPVIPISMWLILFGASLDTLYRLIRQILNYLNPFAVTKHFTIQAIHSIEKEDQNLLHWIDAISEIAIKAITRTLPSLVKQSIDDLQEICHSYLVSAKSIAHHLNEKKTGQSEGSDEVSYTLFYLFQRLELIFDKALTHRIEPLCSHIITVLGKISINSAHFDISIVGYSLHYIDKFTKKAQEAKMDEVTEKAICTLLETGKIITEEVDIRYLEIKGPFFSIINNIEEFSKYTFSKDKSIKIALLNQPFYELKNLFKSKKLENHQDTPAIIADIDRVINQFDQLELVMKTIPKINIPEEESPKK